MAVFLWTAGTPFTPVSWLIGQEIATIVDYVGAGIILFSACFFQWQVASLSRPLAIFLPLPGAGTNIQAGRIQHNEYAFVWSTDYYWPYTALEAMLLYAAQFGPSEMLRRTIVLGIVAAHWLVGWFATPPHIKALAWRYIKDMWFYMVMDMILGNSPRRSAARRRRF
jgi:hypothetical protein